jgi:crotonobetainyl-CoA:carnitine CoA-transferase CaiB-like acyl-CoA transferase
MRDRNSFCNAFPAKDGYFFIAPTSQRMWEDFARVIGRDEWLNSDSPFLTREGRMENREVLEEMIAEWTTQHTKAEIFHLLQQVNIPCGPVNTLAEVIHDPQVRHRDMVRTIHVENCGDVYVPGVPIKINETPLSMFSPPPKIGEHTEEILEELGYSAEDIDNFGKMNVIRSRA